MGAHDHHEHIFSPTPLDPEHEPAWLPHAPDSDVISRLAELLGPALSGRSFAPRMVALRIVVQPPREEEISRTALLDPLLNRVSQMYNDYRTGLLTRPPDWKHVPQDSSTHHVGDVTKLGDAATSVSALLLNLAYWPPLNLG